MISIQCWNDVMADMSGDQNDRLFSQLFCSAPITALAVAFHKIIAGCGNQLLIYDKESFALETKNEVLEGASVHGICKGPIGTSDDQLLCVFGAKETCIVALKKLRNDKCDIKVLTQLFRMTDWIWEARWLQDKPENIAFALAHNSVSLLNWKLGKMSIFRYCVENCILYCAHFIGITWSTLILAAGTVFNQVVLWPVGSVINDAEPEMNIKAVPVIHTLSGHKGVIFSIKYHPEHQRLCSVSDDRSIQMWQLSFPTRAIEVPTIEDWKSVKSVLLMTLFGHTARVWDVVLLTQSFASVGEDATCFLWTYDGQILSKFKGHKGKSIWSIATTEDENILITGGGDGSVRMWEIQSESTWSSSHYDVDIPKDLTSVDGDFPRIVTLLSYNVVLVMMNSGFLASYTVATCSWKSLFDDRRFVSYSIVSLCPDKQKIAVGSITGVIKVLLTEDDNMNTNVLQEEKHVFDSKVMGMAWLTAEILLVSGPQGQCLILKVIIDHNLHENSLQLLSCQGLFLPPSKHRWITACCVLPLQLPQSQDMLICGDKNGSVHCYLCTKHDFKPLRKESFLKFQPSQTFYRVHAKTGVTSLTFKDGLVYSTGRDGYYRQWEAKGQELTLCFSVKVTKGFDWIDRMEWSAGDMLIYGFLSSHFVIWSMSCNQQIVSIHCGGGHRSWGCCLEDDAVRFTYLKAGKIFVVDSKQCIKQSLLKPPLHGRELCDVKFITQLENCEASPDFLICTTSEDTTINVGLLSGKGSLTMWKPLLNLKGHLSSVRCVAVSQLCPYGSIKQAVKCDWETLQRDPEPNDYFLFTGGGRAEIRVWKLCLSSERQIACEKETSDSACGSSSEFHSYEFDSNIDSDKDDQSVDSAQTFNLKNRKALFRCTYEELSTHFLGESRHKNRNLNWKARKLRLDPETRVMSLAATPLTAFTSQGTSLSDFQGDEIQRTIQDLHIVSAAGSDGVLRVFSFNSSTRQLCSMCQSSIHKGCILKMMHFIHSTNDSFSAFFLFSTSTNGCVLVWSLLDVAQKIVRSLHERKPSRTTREEISRNRKRINHEKAHSAISSEKAPQGPFPAQEIIASERKQDLIALGTAQDTIVSERAQDPIESERAQDLIASERAPDPFASGRAQNLIASSMDTDSPGKDCPDESDSDGEYTDFGISTGKQKFSPDMWQPVCQLKSHQSGINSISVCHYKDNVILLASGGDDNALTVQMLEIEDLKVTLLSKAVKEDAHAAQITGLWFVSPSTVVSASIDQRICVWTLDLQVPDMNRFHLSSDRRGRNVFVQFQVKKK